MILGYIDWNVSPEIFSLGPLSIRYYSLFFAIAFWLGFVIMERIFKHDKAPEGWLDKLFMYVIVATIVGARLGHVFFLRMGLLFATSR
jgi:Prolipoprotein diacylglyceryltransferase